MPDEMLTLPELQARIARRAWENPEFEAEFMADPKATFEKYTGQELPESVKIFAHYNSADEVHFVLPKREQHAGDELTDDDLERVAGGETVTLAFATAMMVTCVVVGSVVHTVAAHSDDW